MKFLNPYLTFDGTCEAAFNFYKSVFKKEIEFLIRYKEIPTNDQSIPDSAKEKVMHVVLPISKETTLMGADALKEFIYTPTTSKDVTLSLYLEDEDEAKQVFQALSEGGKVNVPLAKTFWAELYGICTDKFGIHWMISSGEEK